MKKFLIKTSILLVAAFFVFMPIDAHASTVLVMDEKAQSARGRSGSLSDALKKWDSGDFRVYGSDGIGDITVKEGKTVSIRMCTDTTNGTGSFTASNGPTITVNKNATLNIKSQNDEPVKIKKLVICEGATVNITNAVLDGTGLDNVNIIEAKGATVTLSNVTIKNAECNDYTKFAPIKLEGATLTVENGCVIQNCKGIRGGAIYASDSSTVNINGTIQNCSTQTYSTRNKTVADYGGAIYAENSTVNIGGTIDSCTTSGGGGAIDAEDSTVNVTGTIKNCSAYSGGGVEGYNSTINLSGIIDSCKTGGGIYAYYGTVNVNSSGTIKNCHRSGYGGGIYSMCADVNMNGTIDSCSSDASGGGLYSMANYSNSRSCTINVSGTISNCTAQDRGGGIYASDNVTVKLSGTIDTCKSGVNNSGSTYKQGGGICMTYLCTLNVTDKASIKNCIGPGSGGAVYVSDRCTATIGGTIENCSTSNYGGAIYIGDSKNFTMTATVKNCSATAYGGGLYINETPATVSGNISSCSSSKSGGGIFVKYCILNFSGVIDQCTAPYGAGIYLESKDKYSSTLNMASGTIQNCTSSKTGGGIYAEGNSTVNMSGSSILFNDIAESSWGGGIYLAKNTSLSINGTVSGNEPQCKIWGCKAKYGGGIGNYENAVIACSNVMIKNCSATSGEGGSIDAYKNGSVTLSDTCVVESDYGGTIYVGGTSTLDITDGSYDVKIYSGGTTTISGGYFLFAPDEAYIPSGKEVVEEASSPYKNTALYHVVDERPVYTITYYSNRTDDQTVRASAKEGVSYKLISVPFTSETANLTSWNTQSDGKGQSFKQGAFVTISGNITLYAQWEARTDVTRTLKVVDPSGANKTVTQTTTASTITFVNPYFERDGYRLKNYNTQADGKGQTVYAKNIIDFGTELLEATVYAQWENLSGSTVAKNTIIYKDPSGNNKDFTYTSTLQTARIINASFKNSKKSFDCWNTQADGSGTSYAVGDKYNFAGGGLVLYAQWKDKDATSTTSKKLGEYDGTNENTIVKYYSDKVASEDKTEESTSEGKYSITYKDLFGGNAKRVEKTDSSTIKITSTFTRSGYNLVGYSKTAGGTTASYKDGDSISVSNNPTIYAVWESDGSNAISEKRDQKQQEQESGSSSGSGTTYSTIQQAIAADKKDKDALNNLIGKSGTNTGTVTDINTNTNGNTNANTNGSSSADAYVYLKDSEKGQWYYDAAVWARDKGICNGTGADGFDAYTTCSRGMIVTFLWRYAGSPEPSSLVTEFTDISSSDYCYKAVLWAKEQGITTGTGDSKFSPNAGCTRSQSITFLYRMQNSPSVTSDTTKFTDVVAGEFYTNAVAWGLEKNLTNGVSETEFAPAKSCSRAEIVTFIYRFDQNK